ncbi:isopentenyl-diphosphate Delta-isomerase [Curtobacterium sp. 20TX0008]|uniref:isopentenyl-diphosphate Delta-isomerase n=1 Tax=Curtobacterium sp. 20TX0008 TaxID=3022018 RepID=UPI00232FBCB5|nr:isopentenyl-diphosphate Delta-isomerase [Curtobacterium sp. 20TX0008]MDB6428404.1 isopentenyl-diphosphate Delta-isomerase [Curtobacterium sp. 20TX0008]
MNTFPESVVLLAEDRTPIGTAEKFAVHTEDTPLHLAFSCHVRNAEGKVLVTRRALSKKTWPGVWTNTFCGHPGPHEAFEDAVARRASRELGITVRDVELVLPDFRYRAVDASGIVENEVCPVFRAVTDDVPAPADDEVAEYAWLSEDELRASVAAAPFAWSPWLGWQLTELEQQGLRVTR